MRASAVAGRWRAGPKSVPGLSSPSGVGLAREGRPLPIRDIPCRQHHGGCWVLADGPVSGGVNEKLSFVVIVATDVRHTRALTSVPARPRSKGEGLDWTVGSAGLRLVESSAGRASSRLRLRYVKHLGQSALPVRPRSRAIGPNQRTTRKRRQAVGEPDRAPVQRE